MIKTCKKCKREFDAKGNQQFCSDICKYNFWRIGKKTMKEKWAETEYREKMKNKFKEVAQREEIKKMRSKISKEMWQNESMRETASKRMKERWANDEYKKQMKNMSKNMWDSDMRETASKRMKERWTDIDYRNKISNIVKNAWKNSNYRNNQITKMIERWNDVEWVEQNFARGKYHEFELPSGCIIKLQGYEPQILEQLLKRYDEEDIIIGVKNINKEIGKISYFYDKKERRYYPDFYIKSTNTIIEVKSQWTFSKWKDKNLAKEQACLKQGFNFEFIIMD
jgi:hypothetical protein